MFEWSDLDCFADETPPMDIGTFLDWVARATKAVEMDDHPWPNSEAEQIRMTDGEDEYIAQLGDTPTNRVFVAIMDISPNPKMACNFMTRFTALRDVWADPRMDKWKSASPDGETEEVQHAILVAAAISPFQEGLTVFDLDIYFETVEVIVARWGRSCLAPKKTNGSVSQDDC